MKNVYTILFSIISIACLVAAGCNPSISPVFLIAAGILLSVIAIRKNIFWNIAIAVISTVLIYALTIRHTIYILIPIGPALASIGIYYCNRFKLSLRNTLLTASIGYLMQFAAFFVIEQVFHDRNIISEFINDMRDSILNGLYLLPSALLDQGVTIDVGIIKNYVKLYNTFFDASLIVAPSLLIIYCGIFSYVTIYSVKRIFAKDNVFNYFESFSVFRTPIFLFTVFVIMYAVQATSNIPDINLNAMGIFSNISILIGFYIIVCGLSTIDFFLRKKFIKLWQRLAFYIPFAMLMSGMSVAAIPFINPILLLFLVGITDCFFDFRKLRLRL